MVPVPISNCCNLAIFAYFMYIYKSAMVKCEVNCSVLHI